MSDVENTQIENSGPLIQKETSPWDIKINQEMPRRDVQSRWGGQQQGGIATPVGSDNILIFTDPDAGKKFGYDLHEGLKEDGSYSYTGEGQVGDQLFQKGNKALLNSAQNGKSIRLFRSKGPRATYVWEFTLGDPGFYFRDTLDVNGYHRNAIVFNLVPLEANEDLLPTYGGTTVSTVAIGEWREPIWTDYEIQQAARGDETTSATRVEFELQADFGRWLQSRGHNVKEMSLKVGSTVIKPDLFDETSMEIFEAKKSSARGYVRTAIGQVLDYQNNAVTSGYDVSCAILLPGAPADDLVKLCYSLKVSIYVPDIAGGFKALS
jgi:hypothetical protein